MPNPQISWTRLARTLEHFGAEGYQYLEVPWVVPKTVTEVTAPGLQGVWTTRCGDLLGSAEQAFIHMLMTGTLTNGKYCALTPCFREERTYTNIHRPHFMKVELIVVGVDATHSLALEAQDWFSRLGAQDTRVVPTQSGFDLEYSGVEVGSYGCRTVNDKIYTYGTGLAEPRFTFLLANHMGA